MGLMEAAKGVFRFGKPDLVEIATGIFSLGEPDFSSAHPPLGLVHPYYCIGYSDPTAYEGTYFFGGSSEQYHSDLEDAIKTHRGPLVVWEERERLPHTAHHIAYLGRHTDMYFISTGIGTPRPSESGWDDVIGFLLRFNGRPLQLGGGYYQPALPDEPAGCLGHTVRALAGRIEFEVIENLSFGFHDPD